MLAAFAFVFVVFVYTSAAGGVEDESLVNRLPLHLVPALAFYLVVLWRVRLRAAPAEAADSAPLRCAGTLDNALGAGAGGMSASVDVTLERESRD